MLMYSPLQLLDWVSLTYHSFFWSAANFLKPKQHCSCHCASSSRTPCLQSKGLFHFSFLPPPILCLSNLFCAAHTLGEWRADQSGKLKQQQKKGKKRGKKKSFSGLEDSSVFSSGGSNQISFPFTMNQREWRWIPRPCILTNQPSQK